MKKIPLLLVLILTITLSYSQSQTYLGVTGGYNFGSAFIKHSVNRLTINEGFKSGFHLGVTTVNYLQKNVGLQVELNYTQKGWAQKFISGERFVQDMNYVELPLLVNVYLGNKKTRVFITFGTFVEYLVSSKHNGLPADTSELDFFYYKKERDRKIGYGLLAGGGFYHDFSFGTLLIEGRFSFSNSNVFDAGALASGIPNVSNQYVTTISLGYLIRLGKGVE